MKRFYSVVILILASSDVRADHSKQVDKLVQPLLDGEAIVGCVIGVVDHGKTEIYGYGETHRGQGDKPGGDTIYEIGSVSKAFTGTILADMVNRGEVKLDEPVQDFLPKGVTLKPFKGKPIRLVDLASQTSGLPRMPDNFKPKDPGNPYADYTDQRLFEFLSRQELRRAPGEYEYSNLGVGLLGNVLGKKAGKPYEELLIERIAVPLKMSDTRITLSADQQKRLAPGYNSALEPAKNWDFNALAGAGGIRSTANDLMKLVEASLTDDTTPVVNAIHEAWKPHYGKPGQIGVGLCWHIARDNTTCLHNGETGGYTAAVFINKPFRGGVVVVCNTATDVTSELAEKTIQSVFGMSPPPIAIRKAIKVPSEVLNQYAGTYALSFSFAITVTVENGKLMAQATGQDKIQIFPESETKFFYKIVNAQIDFKKDKNGKVEKLILHQNGQHLPGMKLPEARKPN